MGEKTLGNGIVPTPTDGAHRLGDAVRSAPFLEVARGVLGEFNWSKQHWPVEFAVYTSAEFRALVTGLGMRSSMGRTGVCWDNSMAKSFSSMLKNERVYRTAYATKSQARSDVIRYIEGFYNSRRRHSALGYRRPNDVHYGYHQPALAA
jgi:transposase InsO family protein